MGTRALRPTETKRMEAFVKTYREFLEQHKSVQDLADHLGIVVRNVFVRRRRAERVFGISLPSLNPGQPVDDVARALRGWSPEHQMVHEVPEGFSVGGVSTLYKPDGSVAQQWVKSRQDPAAREALLKAAGEAFASRIPRVPPVAAPALALDSLLLNVFPITDYHLGMLAWGEETGADWDLKIAEDLLVGWFHRAIMISPPAESCVFAQMGDFVHWDGMEAVTPAHKNILDADTRFQKLVRVAIRVQRRVIAMLLTKHKQVHVIIAEGNHDPAGSVWMREWFSALFEDEPRVTVNISPDPYYCYEHGKTGLFFHHGHLSKIEKVDSVFVGKYPEIYGRTKHHYGHVGHRHSVDTRETNLMIVEQHRTLAAADAYAARGGWLSGRDAQVITYHREFGEVGRCRISPQMVMGVKHEHKRKVYKTESKEKARVRSRK